MTNLDQLRADLDWLRRVRQALRARPGAVWICCVFDKAADRKWSRLRRGQ